MFGERGFENLFFFNIISIHYSQKLQDFFFFPLSPCLYRVLRRSIGIGEVIKRNSIGWLDY